MKTTLLIMAAGLGSRYGGDKQIDGLGPNGEILMQYSIFDAIRAGFEKIVFIIKPAHREIIERVCADIKGVEIAFAYQEFDSVPSFYKIPTERIKPFGTVHAVLCAKDVIAEPFAVINADDFYGADAFAVINKKLRELKKGEATMVSYRLKNTVSRNGAVTRGVCELNNGNLVSVKETYKITIDENDVIKDDDDGMLDPEALVSMNMWGFGSDIFEKMEQSFNEFLQAIPEGDIKAEYALPTMVDKMIKAGELAVSVLTTDAVWFGVTYREDRPSVVAELLSMHENGEYPKKLF